MKFRDDIEPENTWVTSDTHFGHENIVGYCSRPEDHDQLILEQWRAHVPDDATVLHLGDLCWKNNGWFKNVIAPRLTGARKLLILGNHDQGRPSFYRDCGFKIVRPFYIKLAKGASGLQDLENDWGADYIIGFDHYSTDDLGYNEWRLHGHIHNNGYYDGRPPKGETSEHPGRQYRDRLVPFLRNHINLSVEQTRYRPVNLKLLLDAAILGRLPE